MTIGQLIFYLLLIIVILYFLDVGAGIIILLIFLAALYIIYKWAFQGVPPSQTVNSAIGRETFCNVNQQQLANLSRYDNEYIPQQHYVNKYDNWYVPVQQYYDTQINGTLNVPDAKEIPSQCIVPASVSEYCVDRHIRENGDLNNAINNCVVPSHVSETCELLLNWNQPVQVNKIASPSNNPYDDSNYASIL